MTKDNTRPKMRQRVDSAGLEPAYAHVQLLDARQVAALLGISLPTLWRDVKRQCVPAPIRIGPRIVRWRLRDLERFVGAERQQ